MVQQDGSIWNFHSWTEVWTRRDDLTSASGYQEGSWNAADSTPQEMSDGKMQMGPTSIEAVKNMDDNVEYDTPFVISEVNARVHNYQVSCSSRNSCKVTKDLGLEPVDAVGSLIVTKTPGSSKQQDITSTYKKQVSVSLETYARLSNKLSEAASPAEQVAVHVTTSSVMVGSATPVTVHVMAQPSSNPVRAVLILRAEYTT